MAPQSLPNELWVDVLHRLPQSDIFNVSSTSKPLHDLAFPFIYGEFDATKHRKGAIRATELFLRSLLENADLGTYIKKATFYTMETDAVGGYRGDDFMMISLRSFTSKTWSCFREQVSRGSKDKNFCVAWQSRFGAKHNGDAVLAFLLHIVSKNIESLTIVKEGGCNKRYDFMNAVLMQSESYQYSGREHYPLSQLREVRFRTGRVSYQNRFSSALELRIDDIQPYLKLKSVRKLSCDNLVEYGPKLISPSETYVFTAKTLELHRCQMPTSPLVSFLGNFNDLKVLRWDFRDDRPMISHAFDILGKVSQLKATLEELALEVPFDSYVNGRPYLTDMSGFGALKRLQVSSIGLLGIGKFSDHFTDPNGPPSLVYPYQQVSAFIAALPTSLQTLKIMNCPHEILSYVSKILGHKSMGLHNFRQLILSMKSGEKGSILTIDDECTQLAKQIGVELSIVTQD